MDRFDPFVKYADVYGDIINWEKDPMNKPQNQNKYFFSDGKTYYEQICKMLRLMSVFKEAFNQIYSNEDEISEAWENFVNNLSASVVEGSEPDVTLTWTDDSVNFEFTMVPGVPGEQGVGITSISFNSDYTMTITLSDGNTYTSMSLKGETGPQGPQGETGSGLQILDVYATLADLQSAHPTGQPGDAYQVGSGVSYTLYIWSSSQSAWIPAGSLGTVSPSTSNPLMNGTASAGSSDLYSRGDHVHPSDTSRASKEELDALIKTSQSLIDQSFTYRESPAIQDGLARIDKIKGNTLTWNQLVENGSFASTSGWSVTGGTLSASGNVGTFKCTTVGTSSYQTSITKALRIPKGHKLLIMCDYMPKHTHDMAIFTINTSGNPFKSQTATTDKWNRIAMVFDESTTDITSVQFAFNIRAEYGYAVGDEDKIKNCQVIDLTFMGLDISSPSEFTSLFPLSYYSYNQGSLLSFMGNGIKTVGFNQWDGETESGYIYNGVLYDSNDYWRTKNYIPVIANETYYFNVSSTQGQISLYDANKVYVSSVNSMGGSTHLVTIPDGCAFAKFYQPISSDSSNVCVNISGDTDGTYKTYTESVLSLPISTYFPTGMKSAGSVYDELTESKAIKRVQELIFNGDCIQSAGKEANLWRVLLKPSYYYSVSAGYQAGWCNQFTVKQSFNDVNTSNMSIAFNKPEGDQILVSNDAYTSVYDIINAWNTNNVVVDLPLATPTETPISPGLDLNFISYKNGTEQLLPVNGSVPSTSPIISDMTYLSIDDAMTSILEKLANVPEQTEQRIEALEDDVADLQTDTGNLQTAVSGLQTSVGNINTNIGQISSTVAGHTASISDMQSDITDLNTGLGNIEDTVTDNTSRIGTLETGLSATNGNVQNLSTSVSGLNDTVTEQGTTVTALDSIISDISNNHLTDSLGSHELGFVMASVQARLPANTGTRVTIPKPTIFPNNYTPLFIVGMSTGAYNVSICEIPHTFGSRDSVNCRVWNHGSEQTTQISVYILCMRQRQSQ